MFERFFQRGIELFLVEFRPPASSFDRSTHVLFHLAAKQPGGQIALFLLCVIFIQPGMMFGQAGQQRPLGAGIEPPAQRLLVGAGYPEIQLDRSAGERRFQFARQLAQVLMGHHPEDVGGTQLVDRRHKRIGCKLVKFIS